MTTKANYSFPILSARENPTMFDKLAAPLEKWYVAKPAFTKVFSDDAEHFLDYQARIAQGIKDGLTQSWSRRTHLHGYVTKDDSESPDSDVRYIASFDQLNCREVSECHEIISRLPEEYYSDSYCNDTIIGVVMRMPSRRRKKGEQMEEDNHVWLAGMRNSDGYGCSIWLTRFTTNEDAARFADREAERYAEIAREDNERWQKEHDLEELRYEIKSIRQQVLTTIRAFKAVRCEVCKSIASATLRDIHRGIADWCQLKKKASQLQDALS